MSTCITPQCQRVEAMLLCLYPTRKNYVGNIYKRHVSFRVKQGGSWECILRRNTTVTRAFEPAYKSEHDVICSVVTIVSLYAIRPLVMKVIDLAA